MGSLGKQLILSRLRAYIKDLKEQQLGTSVWNGVIELHDVELNVDAVTDSLCNTLPFCCEVVRLHVDLLRVTVPWSKLHVQSIDVQIERLTVTAVWHCAGDLASHDFFELKQRQSEAVNSTSIKAADPAKERLFDHIVEGLAFTVRSLRVHLQRHEESIGTFELTQLSVIPDQAGGKAPQVAASTDKSQSGAVPAMETPPAPVSSSAPTVSMPEQRSPLVALAAQLGFRNSASAASSAPAGVRENDGRSLEEVPIDLRRARRFSSKQQKLCVTQCLEIERLQAELLATVLDMGQLTMLIENVRSSDGRLTCPWSIGTGIRCTVAALDVVSKAQSLGQLLALYDEYQDGELVRLEAPAKVKEEQRPMATIDDFLMADFGAALAVSAVPSCSDAEAHAELEREQTGWDSGWDTEDNGWDTDGITINMAAKCGCCVCEFYEFSLARLSLLMDTGTTLWAEGFVLEQLSGRKLLPHEASSYAKLRGAFSDADARPTESGSLRLASAVLRAADEDALLLGPPALTASVAAGRLPQACGAELTPLLLTWDKTAVAGGQEPVLGYSLELTRARVLATPCNMLAQLAEGVLAERVNFRRIRMALDDFCPYHLIVRDLEVNEDSPSFDKVAQGRFPSITIIPFLQTHSVERNPASIRALPARWSSK